MLFALCFFIWPFFIFWILIIVRAEEEFKAVATAFRPMGYLGLVACISSVIVFSSWLFKSQIYTGYKWAGDKLTDILNFAFLNYSIQEFIASVQHSVV